MTLLADVVAHCEQRNVQVALIGAAAMTVYGISRTTFDTDLLTVDRAVLQSNVFTAADLVLLKLFAGGLRDLLDVEMLLHADPLLRAEVEQHLPDLPDDARQLWMRFA